MINALRTLLLGVLLWALARPLACQAPDTLYPSDLRIAGVNHGEDTSALTRILGPPQRILVADRPNDDGLRLTAWTYSGLTVNIDPEGRCRTVDVISGAWPTARGIRVGDSVAAAKRAYGTAHFEDPGHLLYARSNEPFEVLGVTFFVTQGIVTRIIVGEVVSVE